MLKRIVNRTRVAHIVVPSGYDVEKSRFGGISTREAAVLCMRSRITELEIKGLRVHYDDFGVKPCLTCHNAAKHQGLLA